MSDLFFEDYIKLVNENVDILVPESAKPYKEVTEAMRYSLLNGGKRIRPVLMLMFAKLFGANEASVLPFAVALEMIHTYSLIHDDLPCMDDDCMRRGKPSCHKAYGEATALLAGDALLTESFSVALKSQADLSLKLKALSVLSERAGVNGMIGGQVLDLMFEKNTPKSDALTEMYLMKTGALLSAAAEIGAILGGADSTGIENASVFAFTLGLAFQIIDDILDVEGDNTVLGKPIGSDAANGKTTFVTLYGIDGAKQKAKELTEKALGILSQFSGDTAEIKKMTEYLLYRRY